MKSQHCGRCGNEKAIDPHSRHGFCYDCEAEHQHEKDLQREEEDRKRREEASR
jgi:hypothetical protein